MAKKASKAKASKVPTHHTEIGTRKYQANAPISIAPVFDRAAKFTKRGLQGEGIGLALAYAAEHEKAFLAWAKAQHDKAQKIADKAAA
jgi:hypothetical protein